MTTAQQAATDSDVVWLKNQATQLLQMQNATQHLEDDATGIQAVIPQGDLVGGLIVTTVQTVYDALYPSAEFSVRSALMSGIAANLQNLLQGIRSGNAASDAGWLNQQSAFYATLGPLSTTLSGVLTSLNNYPTVASSVTDSLSSAASILRPSIDTATRFGSIAKRMVSLATTTPNPSPIKSGTSSTSASPSSTGLYVALAAAVVSVGAWIGLRKKHGKKR